MRSIKSNITGKSQGLLVYIIPQNSFTELYNDVSLANGGSVSIIDNNYMISSSNRELIGNKYTEDSLSFSDTNIDKVDFSSAVSYGNYYLIDTLSSSFGIFDFFKSKFLSSNDHITAQTAVEYIKAMIFQRIVNPDSKLALVDNYHATPLKHFLNLGNELDLQSLYRSLEVLEENFPYK